MEVHVNDDILLYAFRYSLTRKSNAPIKIIDCIIKNISNVSTHNILKIIHEIKISTDIGFNLYEKNWNKLIDDLRFELKLRNIILSD